MSHQIISYSEMRSFMKRAMIAVGTNDNHADIVADVLIVADYRGIYSHGLNRLELHIGDVISKVSKVEGEPTILNETAATVYVDGNHLLGPVVGKFCMNLAIRKAKESGIGFVVCRGSNHFGIACYYSTLALEHDFLGLSYTNATPLVATTRGKEPFFGTNPLSIAAPGMDGDNYVLDMATSVVPYGKVEVAAMCGEKISDGWGINKDGLPITSPKELHALLPLGGHEHSSGYKGYGLAMLVEILSSVLSGAAVAPNIRHWNDYTSIANIGHCFIAINHKCFAPGFNQRMSNLMADCRNQEPAVGETEVLVAGDKERRHMIQCDNQGGINYHTNQIKFANEIAKRLNIAPPKVLK